VQGGAVTIEGIEPNSHKARISSKIGSQLSPVRTYFRLAPILHLMRVLSEGAFYVLRIYSSVAVVQVRVDVALLFC